MVYVIKSAGTVTPLVTTRVNPAAAWRIQPNDGGWVIAVHEVLLQGISLTRGVDEQRVPVGVQRLIAFVLRRSRAPPPLLAGSVFRHRAVTLP